MTNDEIRCRYSGGPLPERFRSPDSGYWLMDEDTASDLLDCRAALAKCVEALNIARRETDPRFLTRIADVSRIHKSATESLKAAATQLDAGEADT